MNLAPRSARPVLDEIDPDNIPAALAALGFPGQWRPVRPDRGVTARALFADGVSDRVVVKFAPVKAGTRRVIELGVAPQILAEGRWHDQSVHVQEYVDSPPQTWPWMQANIDRVIALVARFQTDAELTRQLHADLPEGEEVTVAEHRRRWLEVTLAELAEATDPSFTTPDVVGALNWLKAWVSVDNEVELVPSHTDTNHTNVLEVDGRLVLVDWDDLCLSDPSHDLGIMVWWYCPEPVFNKAWKALGIPTQQWMASTRRALWWVAITSLRAALWSDRHDKGHDIVDSFLEDLVAASKGRTNPKHRGSTKTVVT